MISFVGRGSIKNLSGIFQSEGAVNILVFSGKKSYQPIKNIIESQLSNCIFEYYNDFSNNPKEEEVKVAIEKLRGKKYDIILAVGGGSVIDFAKAYRYYIKQLFKFIAIPTTSGTGSEVTQFAVIYRNSIKTSIDNPFILPDYAIVDSQFIENSPKYLKACTAMDAYCQAIESYWAVKSTEESRKYAQRAIELCRDNIVRYVVSNDICASENMMLASHLAGKAINISYTTAAHALSYAITMNYGIPHGHAVALNIAQLMISNFNVTIDNVNDNRGIDFVKTKMKELSEFISYNPEKYFRKLFKDLELEYSYSNLKICDFDKLVSQVNINRLDNNPRKFTTNELKKILERSMVG